MPFETEYKLEDVDATRIAADAIDGTFRSTTIGKLFGISLCLKHRSKWLKPIVLMYTGRLCLVVL